MSFSNNFLPSSQIISDITNANPAVVTTASNHGYETGLDVRLFLPLETGMNILDGNVYDITVLTVNTFSIPVDTSNFDDFVPVGSVQSPQVIPVGEEADSISQATTNAGNITPET